MIVSRRLSRVSKGLSKRWVLYKSCESVEVVRKFLGGLVYELEAQASLCLLESSI